MYVHMQCMRQGHACIFGAGTTGISLCARFVSGLICDIERIATWIIYLVLADACVQSAYVSECVDC